MPAQTTPAQTADLFLLEDLEDATRTSELARVVMESPQSRLLRNYGACRGAPILRTSRKDAGRPRSSPIIAPSSRVRRTGR